MKYMVYHNDEDLCELVEHGEMYPYWKFIENLSVGQTTTLIEHEMIVTRVR